jgi:hypothetical protein
VLTQATVLYLSQHNGTIPTIHHLTMVVVGRGAVLL